MNTSDIEQPVRLALHQHSYRGSEPMKIYNDNENDLEEFAAARRTSYKPRAAVFIPLKLEGSLQP